MKKRVLIIISLCLIFLCVSCSTPNQKRTLSSEDKPKTLAQRTEIPTGKPDLSIEEATWSKNSMLENESSTLQVKVKNIGTASASKFSYVYSIYEGSSIIKHETKQYFKEVKLDEIITLETLIFKPNSPGNYSCEVKIDSNAELKEINEDNNIANIPLTVLTITQKYVEDVFGNLTCIDSDVVGTVNLTGKNYNVTGICKDIKSFKNGKSDFCIDNKMINELYCSVNGHCEFEVYECDHICKEGRCY